MKGSVCILGAGKSGKAAAELLHAGGNAGWVVTDTQPEEKDLSEFNRLGFPWQPDLPDEEIGEAVISPGIPVDHPWMQELRSRGVTLTPEFELGVRHLNGILVAVTGSLGKTSMVRMADLLLSSAGHEVTVSGNIGVPVCEVALKRPQAGIHVLELSSFQLETMREFHPRVALCLNLVPNHLDRHGSLESYAKAKAALFRNMEPADTAWWPEDLPVDVATQAKRLPLDLDLCPPLSGTVFEQGPLRENLIKLLSVLKPLGLPDAKAMEEGIRRFRFPPHRLEQMDIEDAGVVVDDSKSTCLSATAAAVEASPGTLHLILGGRGKGEDLEVMGKPLTQNRVSLYLIGEDAEIMFEAWEPTATYCENCGTLAVAVQRSWARRDKGQTLLFSPGCASFDQFSDYMQRGTEFQRLVKLQAEKNPL